MHCVLELSATEWFSVTWLLQDVLYRHTQKESRSWSAGDDCPFAHGVYEVLLHPLRYRTELCKDFVQRGFCARDVCFFAHFPSEQRTPDEETMVRYNVLQVSRRQLA